MKRILTIGLTLVLACAGIYVHAQSNSTFSIEEQNLTLRIGESRQLHITPSTANIRWDETWYIGLNPIVFADKNGFVTALRTGESVILAELVSNPLKTSQCHITVIDEGSIRKGNKSLPPVDEVEEEKIKFSLTNDGVFTVEGTYWGSGAQTNYLNYVVTDQCIILSFEIDYSDSTRMFYPQPFRLELEDCNAPEYNIYMNNKVQTVESEGDFTKYSIARGSSSDGSTNANNIMLKREDGPIYNLKGQKLNSIPPTSAYIQNGNIIYAR